MNPIIRNILAVVLGIALGGAVNMGIIYMSAYLIPPPAGADVTTMEGLKASLHLFEPKHFLMPFLAHAIGTLVGAFIAALVAAGSKKGFALAIGIVFLAGGIANAFMLPAPVWFILADLVLAYIPMALIGWKLATPSKV